MGRPVYREQPVLAYMSVDLRGLQTGVSQEFLDDSQVSTPIEEVGGKAVAQCVRVGGNR